MAMEKMIKLRAPRANHDERITQVDYDESAPFFKNPRGQLVHRVRSLFSLDAPWNRSGKPWFVVDYWCENSGRCYSIDAGDVVDGGLLFDPGSLLLCSRCEANAVIHGEPSGSQLAGHHVCVGKLRPVNVCDVHGEKARGSN